MVPFRTGPTGQWAVVFHYYEELLNLLGLSVRGWVSEWVKRWRDGEECVVQWQDELCGAVLPSRTLHRP